MEDLKCCEVCGKNYAEEHHIIFKSQAPWMAKIKINLMYLCNEHHRGNNSPHRNKKIDIKYKLELQKKLFEMFNDKDYYTEKEIQEKLWTTSSEVRKITKKLMLYKEGYKSLDIVIRCMGGMLYGC